MLQIDLLLERGKFHAVMDNKIQEAMGSITKHSKLTETLEFFVVVVAELILLHIRLIMIL